MDTTLALDGFHENSTGGWRDGLTHGVEVAVRHVTKALHLGRKALLHLGLARGGDTSERASMERAKSS